MLKYNASAFDPPEFREASLKRLSVRRECEADSKNDREPDQPHGHLVEDDCRRVPVRGRKLSPP